MFTRQSLISKTSLFAALLMLGAVAVKAAPLDTLEVFCLYVEFQKEDVKVGDKNDASTTTGLGSFGSDKDLTYKLDPNGPAVRSSRFYLEKHFEFARNYFQTVSGGRVAIVPRIFPRPNGDGRVSPFILPNTMKFYNPVIEDKPKKQKIAEFDKLRGLRLMSFVRDAITGADGQKVDSADNPFRVAKAEEKANPSPHHKRAYLIFHAGHSRLVDGGGLGTLGADTPNDLTDFYVTKADFNYLSVATVEKTIPGAIDKVARADSLGIILSTGDTLINTMMLSESASQDKVNWGINGVLVNQIGRALGMPDMFDVVRGFSQLGGFCMMDFAGYNSMDGFLPIYPSAWVRSFMGWETPEIARPNGQGEASYRIYAPDLAGNGHTTTLKVPLNEREYLLVENRQRSLSDTVTIYFSRRANANDVQFDQADSVRIPFSFVDSVFSDSICTKYQDNGITCKTKKPNTLRPEGVVTGVSRYDLGLPGSGLLVWRVNEWFIDLLLKEGAVNAYLGDTLRSQYKGVELVEADGFLTIGKEFKDPLGQSAFDYGSGSDMLPHLFRRRKDPPRDTTWMAAESLTVISPYGQANTNAWNDARSHIRLEAVTPTTSGNEKPKLDIGLSGFSGDSIFTFRDSALTLRVRWADNASVSRAGMNWPKAAAPGQAPKALLPFRAGGLPYVMAMSNDGFAQTYTGAGNPALAARKFLQPIRGFDSVATLLPDGNVRDTTPIAVNSLVDSLAGPLGTATPMGTATLTQSDSQIVVILMPNALHFLHPLPDSLSAGVAGTGGAADTALSGKATTGATRVTVTLGGLGQPALARLGPVIVGNRAWIVTDDGMARSFSADGVAHDSVSLPGQAQRLQSMGAYAADGKQTTPDHLALVGRGGQLTLVDLSQLRVLTLDLHWGSKVPSAEEFFTLALADFDRNGKTDAVVLGSRGNIQITALDEIAAVGITPALHAGDALPGWPQVFPRSMRWVDSTVYRYTSEDFTGAAVADLDGDFYPDLLFTALNSVYALDRRGAKISGWPLLVQPRQNVGLLYASSKAPEAVIGSTPVVLSLAGSPAVFVASPDGLILGVDAHAKRLTRSSFDTKDKAHMGPVQVDVADWPITVGGLNTDTNAYPFIGMLAANIQDKNKNTGMELVTYTSTGGLDAFTVQGASAKVGQSWLMPGGLPSRTSYVTTGDWDAPKDAAASESIRGFWLFPSPLRGPTATVHLEIGAAAEKARVQLFDLAGNVVKTHEWHILAAGLQPANQVLDLHHLGADVYSVRCEVWFVGGKKQKWERLGVVR